MHLEAKSFSAPRWACLLIATAILVGCSDGPPVGTVTGKVTIDGVAPKDGAISFFPLDGKSPTSGATITDGQYTAEVPVGKVKIEIRIPKQIGQKRIYPTPDSPVQPIMAEALPPQYNDRSTLTMDVQKGANERDFELKTR